MSLLIFADISEKINRDMSRECSSSPMPNEVGKRDDRAQRIGGKAEAIGGNRSESEVSGANERQPERITGKGSESKVSGANKR
jgi:hypothetical protein